MHINVRFGSFISLETETIPSSDTESGWVTIIKCQYFYVVRPLTLAES